MIYHLQTCRQVPIDFTFAGFSSRLYTLPFTISLCVFLVSNTTLFPGGSRGNCLELETASRLFRKWHYHSIFRHSNVSYCSILLYVGIWPLFVVFKDFFPCFPLMPPKVGTFFSFCLFGVFWSPSKSFMTAAFKWLLQATEVKDEIELCFQTWHTKSRKISLITIN